MIADTVTLPELPEPVRTTLHPDHYTDEHMRAYATEAVLKERRLDHELMLRAWKWMATNETKVFAGAGMDAVHGMWGIAAELRARLGDAQCCAALESGADKPSSTDCGKVPSCTPTTTRPVTASPGSI